MLVTALATLAPIGFTAAPAAQAEVAGDFAERILLYPAESISPYPYDYFKFIETEGWSQYGTGNCNGVSSSSGGSDPGTSTWLGSACDSDGSPPDEVYCRSSCSGKSGYPFIHDHSAFYADYFTGWLYAY